jgi:hypothetical protein
MSLPRRNPIFAAAALALCAAGCDRALPLPEEGGKAAMGSRVSCSEISCQSGELCHICQGQNGFVQTENCVAAPAAGTFLPCDEGSALNLFCDGNNDCAPDRLCRLQPGDLINTFLCDQQAADRTRAAWCYGSICHSDGDCLSCGLSCRQIDVEPNVYRMCQ